VKEQTLCMFPNAGFNSIQFLSPPPKNLKKQRKKKGKKEIKKRSRSFSFGVVWGIAHCGLGCLAGCCRTVLIGGLFCSQMHPATLPPQSVKEDAN